MSADGTTQLDLVVRCMVRTIEEICTDVSQFSDEFNTDGRTFYPGDDPYFEAVDIWYGVTQDLEVGGCNHQHSGSC